MKMKPDETPTFSPGRKWSISFNVLVLSAIALALVLMINYVAARHFWRLPLSLQAQTELSPLTRRVLDGVTNQVKVTVYFEKSSPLYESVWGLLKEYRFACSKLNVTAVDCELDPSAAQVSAQYRLPQNAKNVVIFDCQGRTRMVNEGELSELDMQAMLAGKSQEIKRTHFKGEQLFTSALLSVTTTRPLKAYFVQGHGEHRLDSDEGQMGYSAFAELLKHNNIQAEPIQLVGPNDIPEGQLLIIAGPADTFLPEELSKLDRYLKQGGRLLVLFNYRSVEKPTGLEKLLANWGIEVGQNRVMDRPNSATGQDVVVANFGNHALVRPLYQSRLHLVLPRSIERVRTTGSTADAPQVDLLATTSEHGRVITNIRNGEEHPSASDRVGSIPLMAAAEKGGLRGVAADRGAARILVVGDSIFLGNQVIQSLGNYEFANLAVNWLLARNELIGALGARPIREYKLTLTQREMSNLRLGMLVGMPGSVLLLGSVVWFRRRH
jgi:hypothetical protein